MNLITRCPVCNSSKIVDFYQVKQIPVQSVVLLHTREAALNFPKGDLVLAYCKDCAFVFNRAYQPELVDYRLENESTQRYSTTFNAFEKKLAEDLIQKFDLTGKTILEIGCGQGEFLEILCTGRQNLGIGFDPAFNPETYRYTGSKYQIIPDYYSKKYRDLPADFFCCKMTLEHIHQPLPLLDTIQHTIQNTGHPAQIFFQIPESGRIFSETAFWDLYYEHCSYFTQVSLRTLFERETVEIIDVWTDYEDQYLMIAAQAPVRRERETKPALETNMVINLIEDFQQRIIGIMAQWKKFFKENAGKTIVIWGAGSKCVAFCTTLGLNHEIACAVDINPHKTNTFLPGSGHKVIHPKQLAEINPQIVIMMNPIYTEEIKRICTQYSLNPEFIKITDQNYELSDL